MNVNADGGEPLLGIAGSWHSLRATGTEWRHHSRLTEAFERGSTPPHAAGVTTFRARHVTASAVPSESREPWLLWIEKPDLKRAEFMVGGELWTVIFRGDHWWSRSPSRGTRTNDGRTNYGHGAGPSEGLLKTDLLSRALHVEEVSRGFLLGRHVVHLRGSPRTVTTADDFRLMSEGLHAFGLGADEYLFALDGEEGVLLRSEARAVGEPFLIIEMSEIAFNVRFAARAFSIDPPAE
jgi:outer membrane lipoprotein-sorting protein